MVIKDSKGISITERKSTNGWLQVPGGSEYSQPGYFFMLGASSAQHMHLKG